MQFHQAFRFSRQKLPIYSYFWANYIILFLFKSHHFRTYFLYMIRYNNILRPVHDPSATPPRRPCPKSGGRDPQPPRIDAYAVDALDLTMPAFPNYTSLHFT